MKDFHFYQDVKATIWARRKFTITAESEEEALKYVKEHRKDDVYGLMDNDSNIYVYDNEYLTETEEPMTVEENGGCSTIEWSRCGSTAILCDNL